MTPDPRGAQPVTLPPLPDGIQRALSVTEVVIINRLTIDEIRRAAVLADRASQSARIATLEAALRELLAAIDASARGDPDRDAVANMMRIADAEVAARAALAGETT